jgi:hypothetical protein
MEPAAVVNTGTAANVNAVSKIEVKPDPLVTLTPAGDSLANKSLGIVAVN